MFLHPQIPDLQILSKPYINVDMINSLIACPCNMVLLHLWLRCSRRPLVWRGADADGRLRSRTQRQPAVHGGAADAGGSDAAVWALLSAVWTRSHGRTHAAGAALAAQTPRLRRPPGAGLLTNTILLLKSLTLYKQFFLLLNLTYIKDKNKYIYICMYVI